MSPLIDSFVFGVANSVHCACMCGPLALAFHGGARGAGAYHLARAAAYAAVGAVLGTAGAAAGSTRLAAPGAWVAFVLAGGLCVLALAGRRGSLSIPGTGGALRAVVARARGWSPAVRGTALGAVTPLLPCGLLWAACAGAAVAGSPLAGAGVMAGFAAGSLPVLLLAQTQAAGLAHRFGPRTLQLVQRGAMLLAAATLVWRGLAGLHGGSCCA